MKRFVFFAVLGLAAAATAMAAQSKVIITVNKTAANNGQQMYTSYCAPCHGVDGRGNGQAAKELTYAPADLTQLSRDNHGVFPALHVASTLKFGLQNDKAGSAEMPSWHEVLNRIDGSNSGITALRVSNIVHYVETLQAQ